MKLTAAVAVALLAAVMFATASSPAAGTAASSSRIEVTARLMHANTAQLAPPGRAGDAVSQHWVIRDRYGADIGDLLIDCRWVTSGLRLCVAQASFPLGAIALLGASRTGFLGQLAVVGGTGRYAGAKGTMLFSAIGTGAYVLSFDYDLDR